MALPFALLAAPSVAKSAFGLYQGIKGANIAKKLARPQYDIPEEIYQNLSDAERMALEGMPAEQKNQYIQNIQRSGVMGLNMLQGRKAGISGVGDVLQTQNDAYANLLAMDASQRQQNMGQLFGARGDVAQAKDTAFQLNELQPYMDEATAAESMKGAGIQNVFGGLTEGIGTVGQRDIYQQLAGLGGGGVAGATPTTAAGVPTTTPTLDPSSYVSPQSTVATGIPGTSDEMNALMQEFMTTTDPARKAQLQAMLQTGQQSPYKK